MAGMSCSRCKSSEAVLCQKCRNAHIARIEVFTSEMRARLVQENKHLENKLAFLGDECLFDNLEADLWLKAGDGGDGSASVQAHRHILASKSPVFRAMLSSEMKEPTMGTVEVKEGCSLEGLRAFVRFLYTAKVDEEFMDSNWAELLDLAVKYSVEQLQEECVHHVSTRIIPELQLRHKAIKTPEEVEVIYGTIVLLLDISHKYGVGAITEAVVNHMMGDEYRNAYQAKFLSSRSFAELKKSRPLVALLGRNKRSPARRQGCQE